MDPSLVVLSYLYLILRNDQIQDTLVGADQDWGYFSLGSFGFAFWNLIFALAIWFWTRMLLAQTRPPPAGIPSAAARADVHWVIRVVPRFLGAVIPISSAIAIWRMRRYVSADESYHVSIIIKLVVALAVYLTVVLLREPVQTRLSARWGLPAPTQRYSAFLNPFKMSKAAIIASSVWFIVSVVLLIWATADPVGMGHFFGPLIAIPLGLSGIATGLSLLVLFGQWCHLPVFVTLLGLAAFAGYFANNHQVRSLPPIDSYESTKLADAFKSFDQNQPRLLIVAAAGGGVRAAYWTAFVLSKLHDDPDVGRSFDNSLFAVSGVSGGGYGAVVYRAIMTAQAKANIACSYNPETGEDLTNPPFSQCARVFLKPDGLGPTVVAGLYPDLIQRFIPITLFPDRAQALELAWEAAWKAGSPDTVKAMFSKPFSDLWASDGHQLPILLLNGTSVSGGGRIITSNLDLSGAAGQGGTVFHDVSPFPNPRQMNIAASTAATNTARFPIVTPPGTIKVEGVIDDQIVDGGIFENAGAETALELYDYLASIKPSDMHIGVLTISSDPDFPDVDQHCGDPPRQPGGDTILPDITSPVYALLASRSARGIAAVDALKARVERDWKPVAGQNAPYFDLRLTHDKARAFEPLGWSLSTAAANKIEAEWPQDSQGCNSPSVHRIKDWLRGNGS